MASRPSAIPRRLALRPDLERARFEREGHARGGEIGRIGRHLAREDGGRDLWACGPAKLKAPDLPTWNAHHAVCAGSTT